ncbi:MAG: hypothetical protein IT427_14370 [Pirellulales bacterium]|nr:hypothetical protein [Pirellulales bacterium]
MRKLLGLSAAAMVGFIVNSAHAGLITVTNTTTSATLFSDDGFEDDTVGTPPNAPAIGVWTNHAVNGSLAVTNAAVPGPYDGSQYLMFARPAGTGSSTDPSTTAEFSTVPLGEALHASFAFQYQSTGKSSVSFTLLDATTPLVNIYAEPDYGAANFYTLNGSFVGQVNSSLAVTPGQWQTIGIDYTAGSADLTLTVNGTSEVLTGAVTGGAPDRIRFATAASNTTYYIDAVVPEPASFMLAIVGLGLAVCTVYGKAARNR